MYSVAEFDKICPCEKRLFIAQLIEDWDIKVSELIYLGDEAYRLTYQDKEYEGTFEFEDIKGSARIKGFYGPEISLVTKKKEIATSKIVDAMSMHLQSNDVYPAVEKAMHFLNDEGECSFDILRAIGITEEEYLMEYETAREQEAWATALAGILGAKAQINVRKPWEINLTVE